MYLLHILTKIEEEEIRHAQRGHGRVKYGYGLDEILLEQWVGTMYPKWFQNDGGPGFITIEGDPESDMQLSDIVIIDPAMVGEDAPRFADHVVDFSKVTPGQTEHPAVMATIQFYHMQRLR